jgi:hypothetical protein
MEHEYENTPEEIAEMDRAINAGKTKAELNPPAPRHSRGSISELPTRVLLAMVDDLRNSYSETTCWYRPETSSTSRIYEGSMDSIKAELTKRPHVANKTEAKMLRRLMAETRMTEQQIRQVPKYKTMLAEASGNLIKVSKQKFELYQRFAPDAEVTRKMSVDKSK